MRLSCSLVAFTLLLAACASKTPNAHETTPYDGPLLDGDCDPLVPSRCGLPFPSDVYTRPDASSPTRKRVHFGATTLPGPMKARAYDDSDGFSPGSAAIAYLPGAVAMGLPPWSDIAASLADDSPTVLLDAETGERVAHFAEIDMAIDTDEERALLIHPAKRLRDGARYIVAIRRVVDAAGAIIAPSPAFRALRDGGESKEASVDHRRALYADIFARLEKAGVARGNLQIAWDYTTASRDNNTKRLVHMRDDALAAVGAAGPPYVIDKVEDHHNEHVERWIEGRMTVPLYLDKPEPGGALVLDEDGLPRRGGTMEVPFLIIIPKSVTKGAPGTLLQYGHGLLGERYEISSDELEAGADAHRLVLFAVDLAGMSAEDVDTLKQILLEDISGFRKIVDRQHQGLVNYLLAMRMMRGALASDPVVQFGGKTVYDPAQAYYRGDSQGGIFGATYMALTTEVQRGVLGVGGAPYDLLLNRATPFVPFFTGLKLVYGDGIDIQRVLGAVQMHWDRTEPNGYAPYIRTDLLPGTPPHEVLMQVAINDQQVSNLGSHYLARTIGGLSLVGPANRPIWGLEEKAPPFDGSAIAEFDVGAPAVPATNTPLLGHEAEDPHGPTLALPAPVAQALTFLREGKVTSTCAGACNPN